MTPLITILGALATGSLLVLFQILAKLSERFGSVLKMRPLYKWFYVAEFFATIALIVDVLRASSTLSSTPNLNRWVAQFTFILIFYHIPLAIAVTIGLIITWKYWGWLITERKK